MHSPSALTELSLQNLAGPFSHHPVLSYSISLSVFFTWGSDNRYFVMLIWKVNSVTSTLFHEWAHAFTWANWDLRTNESARMPVRVRLCYGIKCGSVRLRMRLRSPQLAAARQALSLDPEGALVLDSARQLCSWNVTHFIRITMRYNPRKLLPLDGSGDLGDVTIFIYDLSSCCHKWQNLTWNLHIWNFQLCFVFSQCW